MHMSCMCPWPPLYQRCMILSEKGRCVEQVFTPTKQKPHPSLLKAKVKWLNRWNQPWLLLNWNEKILYKLDHPCFIHALYGMLPVQTSYCWLHTVSGISTCTYVPAKNHQALHYWFQNVHSDNKEHIKKASSHSNRIAGQPESSREQ